MDNDTFSATVRALLAGDIICEVTHPQAFVFMDREANYQAVVDYLARIGLAVKTTSDSKAYYCASLSLDTPEAQSGARDTFRQAVRDIEPLVNWIRVARECSSTSRPIQPADRVSGSEMLGYIERSPQLSDRLTELANTRLLRTDEKSDQRKLSAILERLTQAGFLKPVNRASSLYEATGKWSYFYDILQHIAQIESIDVDADDDTEQGELI